MIKGERALIVSTMKNEGPYVLEWLAHHCSVGFDDFLIFTNDCDDLTDRILERLQRFVPVRHCPNPKSLFPDRGNWQVMALRFARLFNVYQDAGWIFHTDADEFLQINVGNGTLEDFSARAEAEVGRFDVVSFTSMPFSSGGIKGLERGPVVEQFRSLGKPYAQFKASGTPVLNAIKTMYRNGVDFDLRRNHRPIMRSFSSKGHVWIDGSARRMPAEFTDGKVKAIDAIGSTELAQMNHYAIKSAEAFLVKLDRGDVAGVDRLNAAEKYWNSYNTPGDPEDRYANMRPEAKRLLSEFLADAELAEMHEESFLRHKAKALRLRSDPKWAGIADALGLSRTHSVPGIIGISGPAERPALAEPVERSKGADALRTISSFWVGDPLSFVEHLVIRSFLDAGHPFALYALNDVGPVPEGVQLRDAREILDPEFPVGPGLRHNNAVYSDIFRLLMIEMTGSIWADLDAYCLRPFEFESEFVFGHEFEQGSVNNGVLGLPKHSAALRGMLDLVRSSNPIPPFLRGAERQKLEDARDRGATFGFDNLTWGASGPKLLTHFLHETGEIRHAQPKDVFYPGPRAFRKPLLRTDIPDEVFETEITRSVHFWGKTKSFLIDEHDGIPPKGSYLDRLCARHSIDPREFPIATTAVIEREDVH